MCVSSVCLVYMCMWIRAYRYRNTQNKKTSASNKRHVVISFKVREKPSRMVIHWHSMRPLVKSNLSASCEIATPSAPLLYAFTADIRVIRFYRAIRVIVHTKLDQHCELCEDTA